MELARHWRLKSARYRLEGGRCPGCGTLAFPKTLRCARCGQTTLETHAFSGRGEIYSFSTLSQVPAGFEPQAPYSVALVRLEEGPLVTAQLTDVDEPDLAIGMPVEVVTRRLRDLGEDGLILYGYKF